MQQECSENMVVDEEFEHKTDADINDPTGGSVIDEMLAKITVWAHKYAEKNGWVLNPDNKERSGSQRSCSKSSQIWKTILPLPGKKR